MHDIAHRLSRSPATLAGLAILSSAVYWITYSRPFSLLTLYDHPLYDLFRHSKTAPDARWWLLAAFAAQCILYLAVWRVAQRVSGRGAWVAVLAGAVAAGAILLFMFPIGAADIFDYIVHGRIFGVYGGNPFLYTGNDFPADPFVRYMGWGNLPSTYGPLWVLLSGAVARLAGNGVIANVLAFKLLAGAFFFASVGAIAATLRRVAPQQALAGVVALAWNPLVLYETFGNGHNDIVMVFWVLAAAWLMVSRRYTWAVLALLAGALVKFIPILLLPAAGMIALRDLPSWRARLRFLLGTTLAAGVLIALAYAPFWAGPETLTIVKRQDLFTASLPASLWAWLTPAWGVKATSTFLSRLACTLTVLFALWQGYRARADRTWRSFPLAAFWVMMFYLQVTCLWFQEWYTIWPVALAAILASDSHVLLALTLNVGGLIKSLILVPMWIWHRPQPSQLWWELRLGPASLALPWLSVAWHLVANRGKGWIGALHPAPAALQGARAE